MGQGQSAPAPEPVSTAKLMYLDTSDTQGSHIISSHQSYYCGVGQEKPKQKVGIKTGKPICCCCPDTKKPRDECVVMKGEDHPDCIKLIEAHKTCLRDEGFDVK